MKKIIFGLFFVIVAGVGLFFYATGPVENPTTDIQSLSENFSYSPGEGETLYRISQDESLAEFKIDEVLRGEPFTVVGGTQYVVGDIILKKTEDGMIDIIIGTIAVNARTLKTDNSQRDGAIGRFILRSENSENEFITFTPSSVNELPAEITDDSPIQFSISGDLSISGVTRPETFGVTMIKSGSGISAAVTANIRRSDYNLIIPNVPFVANVSDAFSIGGTFVARKAAD